MEENEDETFDHGFGNGELNENSIDSSLLVFRSLDLIYRKLEEELEDYKKKLTNLRTIATRCLNNGKFKPPHNLDKQVKEVDIWIGGHKRKVEDLTRILNELEVEFTKLGIPSLAEYEKGYEEKLREKIRIHWEEVKQGRQNNYKSFVEMLQQLNQSDIEGRRALNGINAVAMKAGIDLSCLLVDYFLLILHSRPKELERKIETVKKTIQSASLDESFIIVNTFVSVVEFLEREMKVNPKGNAKKDVKNEDLSYGKRETDFLGMMFFEVLNLEIAFGRPIFLMQCPHKESLTRIGQNISKSFKLKLERIRLKRYELKKMEFAPVQDEDLKMREKLEGGVKQRWYKLSFSKELTEKVESLRID